MPAPSTEGVRRCGREIGYPSPVVSVVPAVSVEYRLERGMIAKLQCPGFTARVLRVRAACRLGTPSEAGGDSPLRTRTMFLSLLQVSLL
jgi:hypothetical protein